MVNELPGSGGSRTRALHEKDAHVTQRDIRSKGAKRLSLTLHLLTSAFHLFRTFRLTCNLLLKTYYPDV